VITVDDNNPTPPFEQIRSQLSAQILTGVLADGDRLPSVRQLASDLGLAPGTVARAYSILEADALIESRRGAGTRVRHQSSHPRTLVPETERFIREARANSLTLEETVQIIRATWA